MNLHPMIVHFPIALFTLYAIVEIFGLDRKWSELKWVKRFLLVFSFIFSLLAIWSGNALVGEGADDKNKILSLHQTMAVLFAWVSGILSAGVLSQIIRERNLILPNWANKFVSFFLFFTKRWVSLLLALLGLLLITITGALGGIMVYGPDVDPVTKLLYSIIGK